MKPLAKVLRRCKSIEVDPSKDNDLLQRAKKRLFLGLKDEDQRNCTDDKLKGVGHYLIEFVSNRRKGNGECLKLTTIKNCIRSVQRGVCWTWNISLWLLTGSVTASKKEELVLKIENQNFWAASKRTTHLETQCVVYNWSPKASCKSISSKTNALRAPGKIGILYWSIYCDATYSSLKLPNQSLSKIQNSRSIHVTNHTGSWKLDWVFKDTQWWVELIETEASKSTYLKWRLLSSKAQLFQRHWWIQEYKIWDNYWFESLFFEIKPRATCCQKYLKGQPMIPNTFMCLVKKPCVCEKVEREGSENWSTTRGMRRTLAIILFEHEHSASSVALKAGHCDLNYLRSYQHLWEETGLAQQRRLPSSWS